MVNFFFTMRHLPGSDGTNRHEKAMDSVPDGPGLGYVPDLASVASLRVEHFEIELPAQAKP